MKLYFTIILLILLQISFAQKVLLKDLKLSAEQKFEKSTGKLKVSLTNHSKDTLFYLSKSCSWQDFYSTNNKKVKIDISECDKNVITFLTLAPNEKKVVDLKLKTDGRFSGKIKIGINIIQSKPMSFDTHEVIALNSQTLWSNDIPIK